MNEPQAYMLGGKCRLCPEKPLWLIVVIGLLIVFVFGYIIYKLSDKLTDYHGVFGMALTHFQVVAIMTKSKLKLPGKFHEVMQWCKAIFGAMFFDFVFTPECQGDYSFYEIWAIVTFGPVACIMCLVCLGYLRLIQWHLSLRMATLVMTIFYIMEVEQCLKFFDCIKIGNGKSRMEQDLSIACYDPSWIALVMPVLWVGYWLHLWPSFLKGSLTDARNRSSFEIKQRFGDIYLKFKEDKWWWEVSVEFPKKWLMVIWEVSIPDSRWQFGLCIATLIIFWWLHTRHEPYNDELHTDRDIENKLQHYLYALEVALLFFNVGRLGGD